MSAEGAERSGRQRHGDHRRVDVSVRVDALRVVQLALALWLLLSVVVLDGTSALVTAKDVVTGGALLALTVAAAAGSAARRVESAGCLVLGVLLIAGSIVLDFGPGPEAVARQWNEVVVGVLLVCLSAARIR